MIRCLSCHEGMNDVTDSGVCARCKEDLDALSSILQEAGTGSLLDGLISGGHLRELAPKTKEWSQDELSHSATTRIKRQTRPNGFCMFCGSSDPIDVRVEVEQVGDTKRTRFRYVPCCMDAECHVDQMIEEASQRLELRRRLLSDGPGFADSLT